MTGNLAQRGESATLLIAGALYGQRRISSTVRWAERSLVIWDDVLVELGGGTADPWDRVPEELGSYWTPDDHDGLRAGLGEIVARLGRDPVDHRLHQTLMLVAIAAGIDDVDAMAVQRAAHLEGSTMGEWAQAVALYTQVMCQTRPDCDAAPELAKLVIEVRPGAVSLCGWVGPWGEPRDRHIVDLAYMAWRVSEICVKSEYLPFVGRFLTANGVKPPSYEARLVEHLLATTSGSGINR